MTDHLCEDDWSHVVLNEGDDVLVRQCNVCGKIEYPPWDNERPMMWFATPRGPWPVKYAGPIKPDGFVDPGGRTWQLPTPPNHVKE